MPTKKQGGASVAPRQRRLTIEIDLKEYRKNGELYTEDVSDALRALADQVDACSPDELPQLLEMPRGCTWEVK